MINTSFYVNPKGERLGFRITGHSGYSEQGSDIVCAAVSSALISLVASLAGLFAGALVDVPCSALIVMILAALFLLARTAKAFLRSVQA